MDEIVNQHFVYEANDDVAGTMSTFTDDPEHEVIPSPMGPLRGRERLQAYYEMLFPTLSDGSVTPVRRLYGDDFVVDETIWHGRLVDGHSLLLDGKSGPIDLRLLHIFDLRDGRIAREQVWVDLALVQRQLGCEVH
jgi:hypothetical protein